MILKSTLVALALAAVSAPAFAGGSQPYSPSVTLFAYEKNVENFCPTGTQPIRYNGVVCCGVPTATGYSEAPVMRRTVRRSAPSYTPSQIPLGKSPHSFDGT
jgi:hypothetical protein